MAVTAYTIYYVAFTNGFFEAVACDTPPTTVHKTRYSDTFRDLSGEGLVPMPAPDALIIETPITRAAAGTPPVQPQAGDTAAFVEVAVASAVQSAPDDVAHVGLRQSTYIDDTLTFTDSTGALCGEFPWSEIVGWSQYPPQMIPTSGPAVFKPNTVPP